VVERTYALDGAVRQPLCERTLAGVEGGRGGPERAIGVRAVLENAQRSLEGCAPPGRRTHGRTV
jgi:hypothetical protein